MQQIPALFYAEHCSLQLPNLCTSFKGFFLMTLSQSHTLVLQTAVPIHHTTLCRNGHSNSVLTDHLCIYFTYMLYWTFILAAVTCNVKTAHAAYCANMKKGVNMKSSHSYSLPCVMCDIWNKSQDIPQNLSNSFINNHFNINYHNSIHCQLHYICVRCDILLHIFENYN